MSVLSVTEDWQAASVQNTGSSTTVKRAFDVEFNDQDSPVARPLLAIVASSTNGAIPQYGDPHPAWDYLYVSDLSSSVKGPFLYRVTATYSNLTTNKKQETQSPLDQPPQIEFSFAATNEQIDRDINDDPILNSALESHDPPITRDFYDLVIRITKNQSSFDYDQAAEYISSINSDRFYGFSPYKVKCNDYSGRSVDNGAFRYWETKYEFQVRQDGWDRRVLDQGFRSYDGDDDDGNPIFTNFTDSSGNAVSQPVLLNGSGAKLSTNSDAVFNQYFIYEAKSFSRLNLT